VPDKSEASRQIRMVVSVTWAITRKSFRPSASYRLIVIPQVHGPRGMLLGQSGLTYQEPSLLCRTMEAAVNSSYYTSRAVSNVHPERRHGPTTVEYQAMPSLRDVGGLCKFSNIPAAGAAGIAKSSQLSSHYRQGRRYNASVPEIIDTVFAKTSPKRSFSMTEY
jgi:hypothetical protein